MGAGSTTSGSNFSPFENRWNDWPRAKVWDAPSVRNDFEHGDAFQIENKLFTDFFLSRSRISYRQCEILIAGGGHTSIILKRLRYGPFLYALQAGHRKMAKRMFQEIPSQSLAQLSFKGIKNMLETGDNIQIPDPILIAAAQAGNLEARTGFVQKGAEAAVRAYAFNDMNFCSPEDRKRDSETFFQITSSIIHASWLETLDMRSYYRVLRRVAECDITHGNLVIKLLSLLVFERRIEKSQFELVLHYALATAQSWELLRTLWRFERQVGLIVDDRDEQMETAISRNRIQDIDTLLEAKFDFRQEFFMRALDLCVCLGRETAWKRLTRWEEQALHGPSNNITLHFILYRQGLDIIRSLPSPCHGSPCDLGDVSTGTPARLSSHAISPNRQFIPSENSGQEFGTFPRNGSSSLIYHKGCYKYDDQEIPTNYVQHLTIPTYAVARGEFLLSLPCRSVPRLFELP